ncbi:hypothetical protein, partial [Flavobacterium longum]|uniref:hypothetical protein n=1 Tax=Flavobacterium longum TaxID=1299340 RepID=UPI0039EA2225
MAKITSVTVKELKEDFYTYSSATSARVREFSFAGIAAIWLFKTTIYEQIGLGSELIENLKLFIW